MCHLPSFQFSLHIPPHSLSVIHFMSTEFITNNISHLYMLFLTSTNTVNQWPEEAISIHGNVLFLVRDFAGLLWCFVLCEALLNKLELNETKLIHEVVIHLRRCIGRTHIMSSCLCSFQDTSVAMDTYVYRVCQKTRQTLKKDYADIKYESNRYTIFCYDFFGEQGSGVLRILFRMVSICKCMS